MKKRKFLAALMCIFNLILVAGSFAQESQSRMKWEGSGSWGTGTEYHRMYNPNSVAIISGVVVSLEKMTPLKGMYLGVNMMVKTVTEVIPVHLGPAWFIKYQDIMIENQDRVQVKGSRITFEGKPALIAVEVRKGEDILTLRDDSGFPVWSAWKRP